MSMISVIRKLRRYGVLVTLLLVPLITSTAVLTGVAFAEEVKPAQPELELNEKTEKDLKAESKSSITKPSDDFVQSELGPEDLKFSPGLRNSRHAKAARMAKGPRGSNKNKAAPPPTSCRKKQLELKDCHLQVGERKVHVWNDKIILNTPVARDLKPVIIDSAAEWEFVKIVKLMDRTLLEVALWSTPKGEGDVSSLIWTVYEFDDQAIHQKASTVLQKRKRNETAQKYKYDPKIKYSLHVKNGVISWVAGDKKGSF